MKNRKFSYQKWFDAAQDELNFAKVNLQEQPKFPWYICFHAQQAAEKALKAFLFYKQYPKELRTHNLIALLNLCEKYDKEFNKLSRSCKILNGYYTPTRYPDALPGMTFSGVFKKNEAKEAVELSEEIVKFVKEKIHIK